MASRITSSTSPARRTTTSGGWTSRRCTCSAPAEVLDTSGDGESPKTVGGGLGVRMPVGDRLTFRLDGRYLHLTDDGGNQVAFTLSIGGVFGR